MTEVEGRTVLRRRLLDLLMYCAQQGKIANGTTGAMDLLDAYDGRMSNDGELIRRLGDLRAVIADIPDDAMLYFRHRTGVLGAVGVSTRCTMLGPIKWAVDLGEAERGPEEDE